MPTRSSKPPPPRRPPRRRLDGSAELSDSAARQRHRMRVRGLAAAGSVAVLGIGAAALLWPRQSTITYGIPMDDADALAYVRAVAARDLVMGSYVLWEALANDRKALEAGLAGCVIAPAADFILARGRRGNVPQLAIHGAGVLGVLAVWALVRSGA